MSYMIARGMNTLWMITDRFMSPWKLNKTDAVVIEEGKIKETKN